MRRCWLPTAILALILAGPAAPAVDLTKIDRTIAKEPPYQGKPKYCLLVFGPEAKGRVWLVLDGKVLYVDRNGDGDLTGADERVQANEGGGRYSVGKLIVADGKLEYSQVELRNWKNDRIHIMVIRKTDLEHRNKVKWGESLWQYAGPSDISHRGWVNSDKVFVEEHDFRFGDSAKEAPIIHFDGPLTLKRMDTRLTFVRGDKPTPLHVSVGTPGLGKGTFTQILFLPGDPAGVAEIVFPNRDPAAKPIVVQVVLNAPG